MRGEEQTTVRAHLYYKKKKKKRKHQILFTTASKPPIAERKSSQLENWKWELESPRNLSPRITLPSGPTIEQDKVSALHFPSPLFYSSPSLSHSHSFHFFSQKHAALTRKNRLGRQGPYRCLACCNPHCKGKTTLNTPTCPSYLPSAMPFSIYPSGP